MSVLEDSEKTVLTRKLCQGQDAPITDCLPQNHEHKKPVFLGVDVDMYTDSLTNHGVLKSRPNTIMKLV